jgi:hypothetical protein
MFQQYEQNAERLPGKAGLNLAILAQFPGSEVKLKTLEPRYPLRLVDSPHFAPRECPQF